METMIQGVQPCDGSQAQVDWAAVVVGDTPQCRSWRARIYARHGSLSKYLESQHRKIAVKQGFVSANQWLVRQEESLKIGRSGLFCDDSDEAIRDYAEAKSKKIEKQIHEAAALIGTADRLAKDKISDYIRREVQRAGVDYPLPEFGYTKREMIAAFARVCDPAWWRRQLRSVAVRQYESYVRSSGLVGLSGQIYCSNFTLNRRVEQKRRNRHLLESLEAENDQGQVYTLAELADLSVSNPINRRNELMTRINGFELYAKQHPLGTDPFLGPVNFIGLFLTLTAPSKYHAGIVRQKLDGSRYSIPNPKFNGSSARDTHEYLCEVWAKIRAEWQRRGIQPFGFRMVEPHHDGTPHWHMVLFVPESRLIEASYVFQHYALREDGKEQGADEYRTKIVYIDPAKGSAAGYCAKYVAKNIDGFSVGADSYGRDAILSAARIEAWASINGIRQFQQIGGPSVTVWREARRIKSGDLVCEFSEDAAAIIEAADSGDWETYTDLMGGAVCPRKERPIRPLMIIRPEYNRYGEFLPVLEGLTAFHTPIITRSNVWKIQPVGTAASRGEAASWSSSLTGFYASPQAA